MRTLRAVEKQLLSTLLAGTPDGLVFLPSLDTIPARSMKDGGMGSVAFYPESGSDRRFGGELIAGEFKDEDGVPVSVVVNIDQDGGLYELDVWKVDNSPLRRWPAPQEVVIRQINRSGS
jgi:hypothetical protein